MQEGKPLPENESQCKSKDDMRSGAGRHPSPPWQSCHSTPLPCIFATVLEGQTEKWKLRLENKVGNTGSDGSSSLIGIKVVIIIIFTDQIVGFLDKHHITLKITYFSTSQLKHEFWQTVTHLSPI